MFSGIQLLGKSRMVVICFLGEHVLKGCLLVLKSLVIGGRPALGIRHRFNTPQRAHIRTSCVPGGCGESIGILPSVWQRSPSCLLVFL